VSYGLRPKPESTVVAVTVALTGPAATEAETEVGGTVGAGLDGLGEGAVETVALTDTPERVAKGSEGLSEAGGAGSVVDAGGAGSEAGFVLGSVWAGRVPGSATAVGAAVAAAAAAVGCAALVVLPEFDVTRPGVGAAVSSGLCAGVVTTLRAPATGLRTATGGATVTRFPWPFPR
jgi:hypothetical protein